MANMVKLSKALSDQNRVKILGMLSDGDKNVSSVADVLNVEENLASHHLRVLYKLGFLKSTKKGREVYYGINKARLVAVLRDLNENPFFKELMLEAVKDEK